MLEALTAGGFVRPRYDDGTLEEPLPLLDLVLERVVLAGAPRCLVVRGGRGSGLTTLLGWLTAQLGREGVRALGPGPLAGRLPLAYAALDRGEAVLLLDLSVQRAAPVGGAQDPWLLLRQAVARRWRAVVTWADLQPDALPDEVECVRLAPWTWDDVVELLAARRFSARRGELLAALRSLPDAPTLISRPRTAVWLLDAALALAPDEPVTLGRLYANVLDTLAPSTLDLLRALPAGPCTAVAVLQAILAPLEPAALQVEQVSTLCELSPLLAKLLDEPAGAELSAYAAAIFEAATTEGSARLALPGLHHLLQAGDCLARVARDDPPATIAPEWFPFLRELMTEPLRARLRAWLTEPALEATGDAQAATLLWATGEAPPLDGARRRLALDGAWLEGLTLPGADLTDAYVARTRLRGARLQGARLPRACLVDVDLDQAALDGADLSQAVLKRTSLVGAALQGVRAVVATLGECDLRRASLEGAELAGAAFGECRLEGSSLRRVDLRRGELAASPLDGADLTRIDLGQAALTDLDLSRAASFRPASLLEARVTRCQLAGVDLAGLEAARATWLWCDLTEVSLAQASLAGARLERCHAHGARFDGADLRGATFQGVSFQAGSSRAGLLVGKPALEGSMTGYYAEGTTDEAWAAPETLRQASFVGADLRGARFRSTNLFRVDLRGAALDDGLRAQAREQGALLDL